MSFWTAGFLLLASLAMAAPPDGITFAPQIIVQSPPASLWRTWLPIGVAALSAGIAAASAYLAWRNQVFGFAKDAAAIARDFRARQSAAALLAFENSVARPIGMALDLIERLSVDLGKLRPLPDDQGPVAQEAFGTGLIADHSQGLRLCREADGSLLSAGRPAAFARAFGDEHLDDKLLDAGAEALSQDRPAAPSARDAAAEAVTRAKIELRRLLEAERAQEAARWLGTLDADPFFNEVQRWLPKRLRRTDI